MSLAGGVAAQEPTTSSAAPATSWLGAEYSVAPELRFDADGEWRRIRRWWPEAHDAEARRLELALTLAEARARTDVPPAEIQALVGILDDLEDQHCDRRDSAERASRAELEPARVLALREHLRRHRDAAIRRRLRERLRGGAEAGADDSREDRARSLGSPERLRALDPFLPVPVCRYR